LVCPEQERREKNFHGEGPTEKTSKNSQKRRKNSTIKPFPGGANGKKRLKNSNKKEQR